MLKFHNLWVNKYQLFRFATKLACYPGRYKSKGEYYGW